MLSADRSKSEPWVQPDGRMMHCVCGAYASGERHPRPTADIARTAQQIVDLRPWGHFYLMQSGPGWWVKIIVVEPGKRLSLQYHRLRMESWTVVEGSGIALVGESNWPMEPGTRLHVPIGRAHRIKAANFSGVPLIVVEVATGDCREDDIVRLEDDYGRAEARP